MPGSRGPRRRCCSRAAWRRRPRRCSALLKSGRRGRLQRRDLRRHAASARRSVPALRHRVRFVDDRGTARARAASSATRTRVLWFESPINPTLRCLDVAAIAAACRAKGVIVDHRQHLREPGQPAADRARRRHRHAQRDEVPQRPQRRDRGRARGTGGAAEGRRQGAPLLGGVVDPQAAYALGRGMKTLASAWPRHNASALAVARWLEGDSRVATVSYPGPRIAPGPRARETADDGVRRHGVRRPRRRARRAPSASSTASRCSGARPASAASRACAASRADLAVGLHRRAARGSRRDAQHGAAVHRARGSAGSDRGSGSGAE